MAEATEVVENREGSGLRGGVGVAIRSGQRDVCAEVREFSVVPLVMGMPFRVAAGLATPDCASVLKVKVTAELSR